MAFPDAWLNELIAKNDIVSVISSYIELKPKGRRLWGLCPIHGEKTPSFSVSPDKQMFYCFGCHAGGTVIQFVMSMERMTFPEAVQFLANRVGMEMPEHADDVSMQRERAYRERLYEACKLAARYYMESLLGPNGQPGRAYLAKRQLSSDAVKRFGIGYAPEGWDNLKTHLFGKGFTQQELLDAGLLVHNPQKNSVYDAYRGRVIFPIIGTAGRVLGFGARVLNNDEKPKYINTGDTPLYNKRNNLYGLYLQKGRTCDDLLMVEGYMDVIGLYEAGVTNAVASLGTALTVQQARLLKRYTGRVFIAYDGDAAGQNAMIRGLDILRNEGLEVRVIVFPDDLDPDEFVRKHGREAFDKLKENALSLNAFKLESMARGVTLSNEDERERYAKDACAFIGGLEPVERDRYYELLARKTGYPVDALKAQGEMTGRKEEQPLRRTVPVSQTPGAGRRLADTERTRAETSLLRAMLQSKDATMRAVNEEALELLSDETLKAFGMEIVAAYAVDQTPNCAAIAAAAPPEAAMLLAEVLRDDASIAEPERAVSDCVRLMKRCDVQKRIGELREQLTLGTLTFAEQKLILTDIEALTLQLKR